MGLDAARFHQLSRMMDEASRVMRAADTSADILKNHAGRAQGAEVPTNVLLQVILAQHDVLNRAIDTLHEVVDYLEVDADRV